MMKRTITVLLLATCALVMGAERRLPRNVFLDKLEGGWLGQIAGVSWGAPTEFKFSGSIIPEDKVPQWRPDMINHAFGQDDLYVEMTFLRSLEQYGIDVSIRQAGIDFANSRYYLYCANLAGRDNLRAGIAPPDSSHPQFNNRTNDIDYQIEADYSGLIAPGMPQVAVALGEKFGRLMNYGDGVYGGQFMGGMYAAAYFTDDIQEVIQAGLACIPQESQYAEMVRDMVAWHRQAPQDWQGTWRKALDKYYKNRQYLQVTNGAIDVRINGAMVVLGLLYGDKNMEKTIVISMRGGFDSDCNPSSSGGVLGTMLGRSHLEGRFKDNLNRNAKFAYTAYNFDELLAVSEKLMKQFLAANGGHVEKDADGQEVYVVPEQRPVPSKYEPSWQPGPIANSMFTPEELKSIQQSLHPAYIAHLKHRNNPTECVQAVVDILFPGWKASPNAPDMTPGYVEKWLGRSHVLRTHPLNRQTGAFLTRAIDVTAAKPVLSVMVSCHGGQGDFEFIARANDEIIKRCKVRQLPGKPHVWETIRLDLGKYAGTRVNISLENHPNDWMCEAAHWAALEMVE